MQIHTSIRELRNACSNLAPIALVPTMGNLHEGHLSLVETARRHCQTVVVSIFVNRLQFSPNEDFDRYPRTFSADCDKLAAAGADLVFAPGETELYPVAQQFFVDPPARLDDILEGAARPGHFRGVATVVLKLFNIVAPQVAVFGKKDYQQLQVIRHMVEQLALPIEIVGEKICRDTDGLALSSRNGYLSASERAEAPRLYRLLTQIRAAVESGHQDFALLEKNAAQELDRNGWQVDYISLRRQADLLPPSVGSSEPLVVLAAARLGNTRLIDNLEIGSRS